MNCQGVNKKIKDDVLWQERKAKLESEVRMHIY